MGNRRLPGTVLLAALSLAGCGGGSASSSSSTSPGTQATSSSPSVSSTPASSPSAPSQPAPSEKQAAATGDIPDNQVFLSFRDAKLGVAIRYPEGWTERHAARGVTFTDKANQVTLAVTAGGPPTAASVRRALTGKPGTSVTAVNPTSLPAGPAVKATYTVQGRPDPVTGKRPVLVVDRYVYARGGRVATLDLATPKGVDNVDAYRMISRSLRWL